MKLKTIFEELTTKPNEFSKTHEDENIHKYEFSFIGKDGEEKEMEVGFNLLPDLKEDFNLNIFELFFVAKNRFIVKTNYGNPDKVFATIVAITKKFLDNNNADGLLLSAGKRRMRVYKRLIPQFITKDFELIQKNFYGSGSDDYFIIRKEKKEQLKKAVETEEWN